MSKTGGLICLVLQARLVFIKWFHKLSITIKDDRYVVQQIYKKEHHCNNTVSQVVISLTHTHYHTHIIDWLLQRYRITKVGSTRRNYLQWPSLPHPVAINGTFSGIVSLRQSSAGWMLDATGDSSRISAISLYASTPPYPGCSTTSRTPTYSAGRRRSCAPSCTTVGGWDMPVWAQCAAVRTKRSEISVPPQNHSYPSTQSPPSACRQDRPSTAIWGNSSAVALSPPTIAPTTVIRWKHPPSHRSATASNGNFILSRR